MTTKNHLPYPEESGGDKDLQKVHELIKKLSQDASQQVNSNGTFLSPLPLPTRSMELAIQRLRKEYNHLTEAEFNKKFGI